MKANEKTGFTGANMRYIRQVLGWDATTVAARLGISAPYLSQMERGDRPVPDGVAAKFVEISGVAAGALCGVSIAQKLKDNDPEG